MFALVRALLYAAVFIGLLLVYAPAQILTQAGITAPVNPNTLQYLGALVAAAGGLLALWCVITFALVGKGTPAPFDAPRKLVTSGPYRFLRNPMYLGAGLALLGAALYYRSWNLVGYTALLLAAVFLFIVLYEEPHLRSIFGQEYEDYCQRVNRWIPKFK